MRDTINPNSILLYIDEINQFKDEIKQNSYSSEKVAVQGFIIDILLERTICYYSIGSSKEIITGSLLELLEVFQDLFKFDFGYGDYDTMIWTLSLCLLCDVGDEEFKRVISVLERDKVQDALLEMIIKHKLGSWPYSTGSVIQKHPYERAQYLNSAADIKEYLNKIWYKGHDEAGWHDMHKNKKVNHYFGYWAWETAAIVKIKGIDDSSLKDQLYYPYDAVHW
jgi:hypothetical protein